MSKLIFIVWHTLGIKAKFTAVTEAVTMEGLIYSDRDGSITPLSRPQRNPYTDCKVWVLDRSTQQKYAIKNSFLEYMVGLLL